MNRERLYKVLLGPVVSEKATWASDRGNQVVFRVMPDAVKGEIKAAVEMLFKVKVERVQVVNIKGKTKRNRFGEGTTSATRKAYVRLAQGHDIDFASFS